MAVQTPNMALIIPQVGVDTGITWENSVNLNSQIIDAHNHTPGSGVLITPEAISINSDFPFNDFNAISLRSTRFQVQPSALSGASDLGCLYVSGIDLYYNDASGNQIKITSGGTVNATASGISSGTASASFVSSILTVLAASSTPASIQGGSYFMGNTGTSGSNYLTLEPPNPISSSYSLIFPTVPAQTNVMTLSSSGTMSSVTFDTVGQTMTSVGANAIGVSMNSTGANAIGASMTATGANAVGNSINSGSTAISIVNNIAAGINSTAAGNILQSNLPYASLAGKITTVGPARPGSGAGRLMIYRGSISSIGGINGGEGFTVANPSTGVYNFSLSVAYADTYTVVATPINSSGLIYFSVVLSSSTTFTITAQNIGGPSSVAFGFMCIGASTV